MHDARVPAGPLPGAARWGEEAEGFLSLFGTTVVLPGVKDVRTLQTISALAGDTAVVTRSVSVTPSTPGERRRAWLGWALGRGGGREAPAPSITTGTTYRPRLPVDEISRGRPGEALVIEDRSAMSTVRLTAWFAEEPWRSAAGLPPPGVSPPGAPDRTAPRVEPPGPAPRPGPEPRPEGPGSGLP